MLKFSRPLAASLLMTFGQMAGGQGPPTRVKAPLTAPVVQSQDRPQGDLPKNDLDMPTPPKAPGVQLGKMDNIFRHPVSVFDAKKGVIHVTSPLPEFVPVNAKATPVAPSQAQVAIAANSALQTGYSPGLFLALMQTETAGTMNCFAHASENGEKGPVKSKHSTAAGCGQFIIPEWDKAPNQFGEHLLQELNVDRRDLSGHSIFRDVLPAGAVFRHQEFRATKDGQLALDKRGEPILRREWTERTKAEQPFLTDGEIVKIIRAHEGRPVGEKDVPLTEGSDELMYLRANNTVSNLILGERLDVASARMRAMGIEPTPGRLYESHWHSDMPFTTAESKGRGKQLATTLFSERSAVYKANSHVFATGDRVHTIQEAGDYLHNEIESRVTTIEVASFGRPLTDTPQARRAVEAKFYKPHAFHDANGESLTAPLGLVVQPLDPKTFMTEWLAQNDDFPHKGPTRRVASSEEATWYAEFLTRAGYLREGQAGNQSNFNHAVTAYRADAGFPKTDSIAALSPALRQHMVESDRRLTGIVQLREQQEAAMADAATLDLNKLRRAPREVAALREEITDLKVDLAAAGLMKAPRKTGFDPARDGTVDDRLIAAVKQGQRENGLLENGIVDPLTRQRLRQPAADPDLLMSIPAAGPRVAQGPVRPEPTLTNNFVRLGALGAQLRPGEGGSVMALAVREALSGPTNLFSTVTAPRQASPTFASDSLNFGSVSLTGLTPPPVVTPEAGDERKTRVTSLFRPNPSGSF